MVLPVRTCAREQRFVERALNQLERHNIDLVILTPAEETDFSGDYTRGRLRLTARPCSWFLVFLHEFCHFKQDLAGTPWFHDPKVVDAWSRFFDWLDGARFSASVITEATRHIQRCELDAERRAYKIAQRNRFSSIDLAAYAASANAYVWQYEAARRLRAWNRPQCPPNSSGRILRVCPTRIIRSTQIHRLPAGYMNAYRRLSTRRKHC